MRILLVKEGSVSMSIGCSEAVFTADFGVLGSWRANYTGTLQRDGLE